MAEVPKKFQISTELLPLLSGSCLVKCQRSRLAINTVEDVLRLRDARASPFKKLEEPTLLWNQMDSSRAIHRQSESAAGPCL